MRGHPVDQLYSEAVLRYVILATIILYCSCLVHPGHGHGTNNAFNLQEHLWTAFKTMKWLGPCFQEICFNADSAFDTKVAGKVRFNRMVILNLAENIRNRQQPKRGRADARPTDPPAPMATVPPAPGRW